MTVVTMAGFLYYLPNVRTLNEAGVREAGLAYALGRGGPTYQAMSPGPNGSAGVLFTLPGASGQCASSEAAGRATWAQVPNAAVWVGFDPDDPPTPEDLARERQIDGHGVTLEDGQQWLVPVARALAGHCPLPRRVSWDGAQWSPGEVLERYRDLEGHAQRLWGLVMGAAEATPETEAPPPITFADECDIAAAALALNYRLGPAEISLLGLFSTESEARVALAIIDWPALEALKKKAASDTPDSPPGGAA